MRPRARFASHLGLWLGLALAAFQLWGYMREELERVRQVNGWRQEVEERLCRLEGGRWWRGECEAKR